MSITSRAARTLAETAQANDGVTVDPATMLDIADEIERLRAIVDKLPTTADGVPIGIGSVVWDEEYAGIESVTALRPVSKDWQLHDYYDVFASTCYSTREAAEAGGET